jgi:hypothetical protein
MDYYSILRNDVCLEMIILNMFPLYCTCAHKRDFWLLLNVHGVFLSVMNGEGWIAELHAQRSFCTLGEV